MKIICSLSSFDLFDLCVTFKRVKLSSNRPKMFKTYSTYVLCRNFSFYTSCNSLGVFSLRGDPTKSIHTQKPTHWTSTTHRRDIKIYRPQRRNSTHRHRRHPTTNTEKKITTLEIQQHPIRKQNVYIPHTQTHPNTPRLLRNRRTKRASFPTMGTSQTKHNTTNTNHRNTPPQTKAKTVPRNSKSNHHSKTRRTNSTNTHVRKRSRNIPGPKIQRSTDVR